MTVGEVKNMFKDQYADIEPWNIAQVWMLAKLMLTNTHG